MDPIWGVIIGGAIALLGSWGGHLGFVWGRTEEALTPPRNGDGARGMG